MFLAFPDTLKTSTSGAPGESDLSYVVVKSNALRALALVLLCLVLPVSALAAQSVGPGESTIRGLVAAMRAYARATTPAERAAAAAKVSRRLALRAIARESLGAQWQKLDRAERERFAALIERSVESLAYPRAAQAIAQIKVHYLRETVKGRQRIVQTTVTRPEGGALPVDYTLTRQDGRWTVADISLDGESLAKAVRTRIQTALKQQGYPKLVADLERRVEQANRASSQANAQASGGRAASQALSDRSVNESPR